VTFAGRSGHYGNHIEIEHAQPYSTSYSHLKGYARGLKVGTTVRKGQIIGYVGSSGMATGPHLHFMLFENGNWVMKPTQGFAAHLGEPVEQIVAEERSAGLCSN